MRVLVDLRWRHDGGIGKFTENILRRAPADVVVQGVDEAWPIADPLSPYKLWRRIEREKPDLFWSPGFMPPIVTNTPSVITIHDLIHLEFGSPSKVFYYNQVIRPLARRCRKIITVSQYSKNLITEWLGISEDRVAVVPNGVSENFFNAPDDFRLEKPYFLYVGNRRPYKNLNRMLEAFRISGLSRDFLFLLSGVMDESMKAIIEENTLQDSVIFGGYFDEARLPAIYRGAVASVYVSLSEGFGMPNIEAFAAGTAVITSNCSAMPEIVGGGALLVDPIEPESIAEGMRKLSMDSALRTTFIGRGRAIAKKYSWESSAKMLWASL